MEENIGIERPCFWCYFAGRGWIITCARRWGLIVALTRIVYLGSILEELHSRHKTAAFIDSIMIDASRVGIPFKHVLKKGIQAYQQVGFPDEWKLHHQGGPLGYANRDFLVTHFTEEKIEMNQAIAWNP